MSQPAVGIDLAEIARFRAVLEPRNEQFLSNTFSQIEQDYCFSCADPAIHFAGTFAAKEAIRKTSEIFHISFDELEIRRAPSGKPEVWLNGKKEETLSISITHTEHTAGAVALYTPL